MDLCLDARLLQERKQEALAVNGSMSLWSCSFRLHGECLYNQISLIGVLPGGASARVPPALNQVISTPVLLQTHSIWAQPAANSGTAFAVLRHALIQ